MPSTGPVVLSCLAAAALAVGGCASPAKDSAKNFSGEQKAVATAVEDFQDAAQKSDEDKICKDLITPALAKTIESAKSGNGSKVGANCADRLHDSLRDADNFEIQVKKVVVSGTSATATVHSQGGHDDFTEQIQLQKTGTPVRWRISALGAR